MKLLSSVTLALAITLAVSSCKNTDNSSSSSADSTTQAPKVPKKGDFKSEVTMLMDSTNYYWNGIQEMTQQKYKDIDRLLKEISYTEKYNVLELNRCTSRLKEVSAKTFDPHTMASDDITIQDNAEDSLIARVFTLASKTPGIEEHTIVNTLVDDINKANNDLLIAYRVRYDYYAMQLNTIIEKDKKKLDKLGAPYNGLTKYQVFTLPE